MTSPEAVQRAKSHTWVELNSDNERCSECLLILSKSTDLENVPACTGRLIMRHR